MPLLTGVLGVVLTGLAGSIVARVLFSLGMTVVYYRGVDTALTWAKDIVMENLNALPASVIQVAGLLQVGTCVNIMFTAMLIRVSILGLNSEPIKRLVMQ